MAAQAPRHAGLTFARTRGPVLAGLALIAVGVALVAAMLRLGRSSPLVLAAIGLVAVGVLVMRLEQRWVCRTCGVRAHHGAFGMTRATLAAIEQAVSSHDPDEAARLIDAEPDGKYTAVGWAFCPSCRQAAAITGAIRVVVTGPEAGPLVGAIEERRRRLHAELR